MWWAARRGHLRALPCFPAEILQAGAASSDLNHEVRRVARHWSMVLTKLPVCLPQGPPGPPGPRGPQGPSGADVRTVKCVHFAEAMQGLVLFNGRWCLKYKGDNDTIIRCFRVQSSRALYLLRVILQEKKQAL